MNIDLKGALDFSLYFMIDCSFHSGNLHIQIICYLCVYIYFIDLYQVLHYSGLIKMPSASRCNDVTQDYPECELLPNVTLSKMSVASRCKTIQNVSYFPTYKRLIFETRKPRTWGSDLGFRELIPASISQEFGISLDGTWMTSEKFCVCKAKRMEIVCDCSFFYGSYCYGRICFFRFFIIIIILSGSTSVKYDLFTLLQHRKRNI